MKECVECYDDNANWINESGNPICKQCVNERKEMSNKIENSTKIELLCELAHNRVEEADTSYIIENDGDGQYTEDGQDLFNDYYDYYESIILNYLKEIK